MNSLSDLRGRQAFVLFPPLVSQGSHFAPERFRAATLPTGAFRPHARQRAERGLPYSPHCLNAAAHFSGRQKDGVSSVADGAVPASRSPYAGRVSVSCSRYIHHISDAKKAHFSRPSGQADSYSQDGPVAEHFCQNRRSGKPSPINKRFVRGFVKHGLTNCWTNLLGIGVGGFSGFALNSKILF